MAITTVSEVRFAGGFTSEFSDADIDIEIDLVEAELYNKYYLPRKTKFTVDDDYTEFFIGDERVHEILRIQASVITSVDPSGYVIIGSPEYWSHASDNNYITATSSLITEYDSKVVRVQYIPRIINNLATVMVALNLLDQTTIVDGQTQVPPQIMRLRDKAKRYKYLLGPRTLMKSSTNYDYDPYDFVSIDQLRLRNIVR